MNDTLNHSWTIAELDEQLSRPNDRTTRVFHQIAGDVLVLGAGGKMGPSIARMARRAADAAGSRRRVIAVSRFSDARMRDDLDAAGVETVPGNLLDAEFVASLPECANVVYLAGMKFGSAERQSTTWATNAFLPGLVCQRFSHSRIVCLSTGNVYGLVDVDSSGSQEADDPRPLGEYAMSCLGRERIVEHFSRACGTRVAIIRLNYATELRYGLLVDLARRIARDEPTPLDMGYFNVIWQGDACNMILGSLARVGSPPAIFNVTGRDVLSTRKVCERLGELLDKPVRLTGSESPTALLSDSRRTRETLGEPETSLDDMLAWTADWVARGGYVFDKPTRFEVRDGSF